MTGNGRLNKTVNPEDSSVTIGLCRPCFRWLWKLKNVLIWTGLVCFSSLKRALIILMCLLALDNFSCIASTDLAVCRQVELSQMYLLQNVDYANSRRKLEILFCLILFKKNPQNYKIQIQNINIEQGSHFHSPIFKIHLFLQSRANISHQGLLICDLICQRAQSQHIMIDQPDKMFTIPTNSSLPSHQLQDKKNILEGSTDFWQIHNSIKHMISTAPSFLGKPYLSKYIFYGNIHFSTFSMTSNYSKSGGGQQSCNHSGSLSKWHGGWGAWGSRGLYL